MDSEIDRQIAVSRVRYKAYTVTLGLYAELKAGIGRDKTRETLGFSTGRVVRTCSVDYVADVETVALRALPDSALERNFIRDILKGYDPYDTCVANRVTAHELKGIEGRVQQKVGKAFIDNGIHPFAAYNKPVDVR